MRPPLLLPCLVAVAAVVLKVTTTPPLGMLEPVDLRGRTFLITGATTGLGRWHAETLASWNASLVLPVRDLRLGAALAEELAKRYPGAPRPVVEHMDLKSLASVRGFAERYRGPVDVLVHNAATLGSGALVRTEDGFEECFQVNYLSTFLLTSLLLERVERSEAGRVVHVSAKAHEWADLSLDAMAGDKVLEPGFTQRQGVMMGNLGGSYADSKLAQIMFSAALARRLKPNAVSLSLHPAITKTGLTRDLKLSAVLRFLMESVGMRLGQAVGFMQSAEDAPKTQIHVSTHPALQKVSGRYYSPLSPPLLKCGKSAEDCGVSAVSAMARDQDLQEKVFKASCDLLGLKDGMCARGID